MTKSDEVRLGLGALAVVLAMAGLFVAAWTIHGLWHYIGLGVFGLGVLAVFVLIRLSTGTAPEAPAARRKREAAEEDRGVGSARGMPEPRPEPQLRPQPEARTREVAEVGRG